jgi:hypothetical protein
MFTLRTSNHDSGGGIMEPVIKVLDGNRVKIEVTIDLSGSILDAEESILRAVNLVGS